MYVIDFCFLITLWKWELIMTFLDLNQYYLESKWSVFITFLVIFCLGICLSLFLMNWFCFRSLCTWLCPWLQVIKKSSSFRDGMLQRQTCRVDKELDCGWTKTSPNQKRCCRRCCSSTRATADKIARVLTDMVSTYDIKRLWSKVSKKGRQVTICFWLP